MNYGVIKDVQRDYITMCMELEKIANCLEYDKKQSVSASTFKCIKCNADNYLTSGGSVCKERKNKTDGLCKEY